MKTSVILFSAVSLTATFGLGCGETAKVGVKVDVPQIEPVKVAVVEPVRPVVEVAPVRKQVLVGLPMTGSQIDVLGDIEFDTSQATIRQTPQTLVVLNTLATAGKAYPQVTRLRVEGHTDSDGNEVSNQQLSERRAQAVVQWLIDHGIDSRRLTAVGCGSRDPLVPNTTSENKQKNRRTEFDVEEVDGGRFEFWTAPCAPNPARHH